MKSKRYLLLIIVLFVLPALACGLPNTNTSSDTNTTSEETFVGGECDSGSIRIDMNTSTQQSVDAGDYPASCRYYCLWVPEDGNKLDIGISNFDIDLDMYVDTDLSVLTFEDHGEWESNAYGDGDESVSINNPDGRYYIQVCSYEGLASSFTFWSTFTP
jgi:hypothetical protein